MVLWMLLLSSEMTEITTQNALLQRHGIQPGCTHRLSPPQFSWGNGLWQNFPRCWVWLCSLPDYHFCGEFGARPGELTSIWDIFSKALWFCLLSTYLEGQGLGNRYWCGYEICLELEDLVFSWCSTFPTCYFSVLKVLFWFGFFLSLQAVAAHTFNPRAREAEVGRSLSLKPAWTTEQVSGRPGLYRITLSQQHTPQK